MIEFHLFGPGQLSHLSLARPQRQKTPGVIKVMRPLQIPIMPLGGNIHGVKQASAPSPPHALAMTGCFNLKSAFKTILYLKHYH
jgi:hypothetical protein